MPINLAELARLSWLAGEEEIRQENVVLARLYYDGHHDVKLTERQKEYLGYNAPDARFALNYCKTVVDSVVERLLVDGFESADERLEMWAKALWALNRMDAGQHAVHLGAVRDGESFVFVNYDDQEGVQFIPHPRYTDPQVDGTGYGCKAWYPDDDASQEMLYASKRWTDAEDGFRRANLYYPDRILKYKADEKEASGWLQIEALPWVDTQNEPLGIPIIHFRNPRTRSELWDAIPPQDATNKTALDILAAADSAGFPIFTAKGFMPTTDGEEPAADGGNYVKIFPGCIIGPIPADGDFGRVPAADFRGMLDTLDSFIIKLAQITDTPVSRFQMTRHVAAEGTLKQQDEPLNAKVRLRQVTLGNAWEDCFMMARRLENLHAGAGLSDESLVETTWRPAATRDEQAEELAFWVAAAKAKEAGVPLSAYLELQGWSVEKIAIITGSVEYQQRMAMMGAFAQVGEGG